MIILLQYIISFLSTYKILTTKGVNRFLWFMVSITLINTFFNVYNGIALTKGHLFFVIVFWISLLIEGKHNIRRICSCPVIVPLAFVFLSYLLIGIFDTRLNPLVGGYRGTYNFMQSYGAFLLGWLSIRGNDNTAVLSKKLMRLSFIFTTYGFICFLIKSNPVVDGLGFQDRFVFENANASFREFLVSGFLAESGVYGLSCFLCFLFILTYKQSKHRVYKLVLAFLFINIFLTATRSIMIPAIVGLALYAMMTYNVRDKLRYMFVGILIAIFVMICLPNSVGHYAQEIFASIVDVLSPNGSGGAELGGSNLDVRKMQITTAFVKYLPQRLLFGHGFNFYQEVIFAHNNGVVDSELYGMESYLCFLGVEYGLINIISVVIFFISLLCYFIKNRRTGGPSCIMGISYTLTYILFLIFAYLGDSWLYAMPFLGLLVGLVERKKMGTK